MKTSRCGTLEWRHNERDRISNYRDLECLLYRSSRRWSKKTSKLSITGLCDGNPPVTGGFPSQRARNAEIVSVWWRVHDVALVAITEMIWCLIKSTPLTSISGTQECHTQVRNADCSIVHRYTIEQWALRTWVCCSYDQVPVYVYGYPMFKLHVAAMARLNERLGTSLVAPVVATRVALSIGCMKNGDVTTSNPIPYCWPFVMGIPRWTNDQFFGTLMLFLSWAWTNVWTIAELPVIWDAMTLMWRHCNDFQEESERFTGKELLPHMGGLTTELYRSQYEAAKFFEIAYYSVSNFPDVAVEVN